VDIVPIHWGLTPDVDDDSMRPPVPAITIPNFLAEASLHNPEPLASSSFMNSSTGAREALGDSSGGR
jgi:hypothetical protein